MGPEQPPAHSIAETRIFPPPEDSHCDPLQEYDCEHCNDNYYSVATQASGAQRYQGSLNTVEAQAAIRNLLTKSQENVDYIKGKLQSHGNVLASRWSKKSIDKRRKLLSASAEFCFGAWPPRPSTDRVPETRFSSRYPEESRKTVWPFAA
jgi:hypothetical protein